MRKSLQVLSVLVFVLFLPNTIVRADSGPKPVMEFTLVYNNIPPVSVVDGQLFHCDDEVCTSPILVPGPFFCSDTKCQYNYGSQGFYKLSITFDDKVRESNIFEKRGFISNFGVNVNADELHIEQTNISLPYDLSIQHGSFVGALVLTLVIELPIAGFLLKKWNLPRKWWTLLYANLITLPFVWFVFPFISDATIIVVGLGELFAILAEIVIYFYAMNKDGITKQQAILLSLYANVTSYLIPILLFIILITISGFTLSN